MDVSTENWKGAYGINCGILEKISDDGTYELRTEITHEMKESLNGQKIKVSFKNLVGFDENLDKHILLEGNWNLEWTLQASDKISEIALDKEIKGYDNVVLEKINLTPVSATLYFPDWKDRMEEVKVTDEDGKETTRKMRQEPPALVGLLMKDGTVITDFKGGPGMAGLDEDGDGTTYIQSDGFSRVVDVENVSSLLFLKKEALEEMKEQERAITREDMLEIPLK